MISPSIKKLMQKIGRHLHVIMVSFLKAYNNNCSVYFLAECKKQFPTKANLDRHIANVHKWDGTMHKCQAPDCYGGVNGGPKEYKYRDSLKEHYKDDHHWKEDKIAEVMTTRQQRPKRRKSDVDTTDLEVIEKRRKTG
jgi:hypothetical protein